jgi:hypothetical protein
MHTIDDISKLLNSDGKIEWKKNLVCPDHRIVADSDLTPAGQFFKYLAFAHKETVFVSNLLRITKEYIEILCQKNTHDTAALQKALESLYDSIGKLASLIFFIYTPGNFYTDIVKQWQLGQIALGIENIHLTRSEFVLSGTTIEVGCKEFCQLIFSDEVPDPTLL